MKVKQKVRYLFRESKMFIYRNFNGYKQLHPTAYFGGKSSVSKDLKTGKWVYVGPNCIIYSKVSIGDYTMLANDVSIVGADHIFNVPGVPCIFTGRDILNNTKIGKDVWIGAYCKILAGITIGDGAIIALGSIVTKDVEPFSVYAGVPARKVKDRFKSNDEKEIHQNMLDKSSSENKFTFEDLCK